MCLLDPTELTLCRIRSSLEAMQGAGVEGVGTWVAKDQIDGTVQSEIVQWSELNLHFHELQAERQPHPILSPLWRHADIPTQELDAAR